MKIANLVEELEMMEINTEEDMERASELNRLISLGMTKKYGRDVNRIKGNSNKVQKIRTALKEKGTPNRVIEEVVWDGISYDKDKMYKVEEDRIVIIIGDQESDIIELH